MRKFFIMLALGAGLVSALPALAAEPTLHQVYEKANAGQLDEARTMMREVLSAHPNSGKAHYVEAELLARQGQRHEAAIELAKAEQLAPGLPFASEQSQRELRSSLQSNPATPNATTHAAASQDQASDLKASKATNTQLIALGIVLLAFIYLASRWMSRRALSPAVITPPHNPHPGTWDQSQAATGSGFNNSHPAYYGPTGSSAYGAGAENGSTLTSRIVGGLASGAALGAGIAAGETLVHHWLDNKNENTGKPDFGNSAPPQHSLQGFEGLDPFPDAGQKPRLDESDFGISDNSSWDDTTDSEWS